jgi:hypothetical protein
VIEGRPTAFDAEVLGLALAEDVAAERAWELDGVVPDDYEPDEATDEDEA